MADQEIINVLLKLENPQVLDRVERLKSEQFQIKFSGSLDQGIKDILAIKDKKISIVADVQGAINSLKQVETSLKSLQGLQEIKINLSGNVEKDLDRVGKKALELQAKLYAAELNQLGFVQNYNPKTFSGGDKEIRQAQVLRGINEQTVVANARAPITQQQLGAAKTNQPVQALVNEVTSPYNPGQIRRTRQVGEYADDKAVTRAIQAKKEAVLNAAGKQIIADFNGLADSLIKDISKPTSGASSAIGGGTSDKLRLAKLAEDAALERQGKESAAARELTNRDLNERRIKQNFLNETIGPQGVRVPLSQVGATTKAEAQKEFERANEIANTQIREESLARLRASLGKDKNSFLQSTQLGAREVSAKFDAAEAAKEKQRQAERNEFFQAVQPAVRGVNSKFDTTEAGRQDAITAYRRATQNGAFSAINQPELDRKRQQEILAQSLAGRNASKKELGGLLTELGLGAISGGGGGLLRLGGSLLGGLAGAAVPGGAILGSQIGGALGEGAAKSLEAVAGALENVTQAGLEFQKTIVALTGVLQANTDVIGADGQKLNDLDSVRFNTQQAKKLQEAARSSLLPLGIGGEAEATLVQGLVSGFSQRGIILDEQQTKTISSRLGAAIVTLVPQVLTSSTTERKDIEDIAANSPRARQTVLGNALRNVVPDLFRDLATGDEVVKATERLEKFVTAIKNSDQATVQLLRLSGAFDVLRTKLGDTALNAAQPGFKVFADALTKDDNLSKAAETLGTALGTGIAEALKLATPLVGLFAEKMGALSKTIRDIFPGLDKLINGPAAIAAQGKAKAELIATGGFTSLGIEDPTGEFNKKLLQEPDEKLENIRRLEQKLAGIQNSNGETDLSKFILPLVDEEISTLKNVLKNRLSTLDTSNFSGRSAAASTTIDFSNQQIAAAQSGIEVAQGSLANARKSGDVQEQSRAVAAINRFNQEIDESTKAISLARKEGQNIALDQRKAIQTVRNAFEGLANAEKDQTLRLKDLTRSLQEATDAVNTFASKAEAAFASKEEQGLLAAKELRDAGGPDLLGDLETKLKDAKLRSASAKFNEFSTEVGLGITAPQEESGLKLSRLGTPFSNSIDNQGAKLNDSVEAIGNEIERLPRVLRDLKEAFDDLIARTKQLFNSNNIPTNQPDIPGLKYPDGTSPTSGGVLPPASGGATSGGNLSSGKLPPIDPRTEDPGQAWKYVTDHFPETKGSDYLRNLDKVRRTHRRPNGSDREFMPSPDLEYQSDNPLDFLPDPRDGGIGEDTSKGPLDFLPDPRDGGVPDSVLKSLTPKFDGGPLQGGVGTASSLLERQRAAKASNYENISSIEELYALQDIKGLTEEDRAELVKSLEGTGLKVEDILRGNDMDISANLDGVIEKAKLNGNNVQKGNINDDPNVFYKAQDPYLTARDRLSKVMKLINPDNHPLGSTEAEEAAEMDEGKKKGVLGQVISPVHDNPINFSDSLIARPSVPSRAYNPILREGLNEGLGNKADAKTNAVLEDVVGGFLDADVDGLKKQNRAPASGLKNGLFSGGLFGDKEEVKSGKGTAESNFADSVGAKIDENFNKLGDIISKALGGAL